MVGFCHNSHGAHNTKISLDSTATPPSAMLLFPAITNDVTIVTGPQPLGNGFQIGIVL